MAVRLFRLVLSGARARGVILTEHLQELLDWGKRMYEVILHEHDEQGRHKLPYHAKGYLRIDTRGGGRNPDATFIPRIIDAALGTLKGDDAFDVTWITWGVVEVTAKGPWPSTVHWVTGFMAGLTQGSGPGARVCLKVTPIANGLRVERRLYLPNTGAQTIDGEFSLILYGEW